MWHLKHTVQVFGAKKNNLDTMLKNNNSSMKWYNYDISKIDWTGYKNAITSELLSKTVYTKNYRKDRQKTRYKYILVL